MTVILALVQHTRTHRHDNCALTFFGEAFFFGDDLRLATLVFFALGDLGALAFAALRAAIGVGGAESATE